MWEIVLIVSWYRVKLTMDCTIPYAESQLSNWASNQWSSMVSSVLSWLWSSFLVEGNAVWNSEEAWLQVPAWNPSVMGCNLQIETTEILSSSNLLLVSVFFHSSREEIVTSGTPHLSVSWLPCHEGLCSATPFLSQWIKPSKSEVKITLSSRKPFLSETVVTETVKPILFRGFWEVHAS